MHTQGCSVSYPWETGQNTDLQQYFYRIHVLTSWMAFCQTADRSEPLLAAQKAMPSEVRTAPGSQGRRERGPRGLWHQQPTCLPWRCFSMPYTRLRVIKLYSERSFWSSLEEGIIYSILIQFYHWVVEMALLT